MLRRFRHLSRVGERRTNAEDTPFSRCFLFGFCSYFVRHFGNLFCAWGGCWSCAFSPAGRHGAGGLHLCKSRYLTPTSPRTKSEARGYKTPACCPAPDKGVPQFGQRVKAVWHERAQLGHFCAGIIFCLWYSFIQSWIRIVTSQGLRLRRWNRTGTPSPNCSESRMACSIASGTFSRSTRFTSICTSSRPARSGTSPKDSEPPRSIS